MHPLISGCFLKDGRSLSGEQTLLFLLTLNEVGVTLIIRGRSDCVARLIVNLHPSHLHLHYITAYLFIEHCHDGGLSGIIDGANAFKLEMDGGAESIGSAALSLCAKKVAVSKNYSVSKEIKVEQQRGRNIIFCWPLD